MQEEHNYPPYFYLKAVLTNCPKAGLLYLTLWDHCDDNLKFKVKKSHTKDVFLCSLTRVKNDLLLLIREGLVSFTENMDSMTFEMTGWDDDDNHG